MMVGVEREVKLVAPSGFGLPALDGVIKGAVAGPASHRRLDATYYDCADLRLARAGVTLRYRTGEHDPVWTLKLPGGETGSALSRRELDFVGSPETVPEEARDLIRAYLRSAALVGVARLVTERCAVGVCDPHRRETVEVANDLVTAYDGHRQVQFREVEVEVKTGKLGGKGLVRGVVARLEAAGCRVEPPIPKLIRALGPPAQAPADIVVPALTDTATIQELIHHAVARSVARIVQHDAGVRLGEDPEQVHQFRVAARRLRSDLRTFAPLLDARWVEFLRAELRWLGRAVGVVRDCDVLAERLGAQAATLAAVDAVARLLHQLAGHAQQAHAAMLCALRSARYDALLDALVEAAHQPRFTQTGPQPATGWAAELVRGPWRRLAHAVRALQANPSDEALHTVRILAKRCRYAAEAVVPVAGQRAERFAGAIAQIQTVLGDHQDTVVAEAWLRAAATAAPDNGVAAGELIAGQRAHRACLRTQWPATWDKASDKTLRTWLSTHGKATAKGVVR
jgi:CHAD domain-containing protein